MKKKYSGFAITSLVLGIAGIIFDILVFGVIAAIVGIVFGIIALVKDKKKGMAIAGTVLSGVGIIFFIFIAVNIGKLPSSTSTGNVNEETVAEQETETSVINISTMVATYNGSTEAGTTINKNNSGITVTATYEEGTVRDLNNWTITPESVTLEAGQTYDFTVTYKEITCPLTITCTTQTPEMYKASCQSISFEELSRNPDSYIGTPVKMQGEIIQVLEGSGSTQFRINVTKTGSYYTYWEDTVLIEYSYSSGEGRYLEDDIVTFYGEYLGLISYESVMGATITVPAVEVEYMELN